MKLLKSLSVYHSLPFIHNETAAERETKYSQTFVQHSHPLEMALSWPVYSGHQPRI